MDVDVGSAVVVGSVVGGIVSVGIVALAWRHRTIPGAVPFGWLMLAAGGWCFLEAAWVMATTPTVATTLFLLIRFTSGLMVGLWVLFALVYTGRDAWLSPGRVAAVLLVPSAYAVLALTNPIHGLVTIETVAQTVGGQTFFAAVTGPVYAAQTLVSFGFILIGYALFGEFLLRSQNVYRRQTFVVLVAGLLTAGVHALFVLGVTPHPGLNIAPLTFAVNGLLIGVVLFRYDFLSVSPLAGNLLVDELPDPVLVLDTDDVVVDHNAAAATALAARDDLTGRHITDIKPELLADIECGETLTLRSTTTYYDPQISTVTDHHGTERGRMVVLRNVTGQKRRQDRLEALQAATQKFIEADQPETVARLTVNFAARVLDHNSAGVFLATGDGTLELVASNDGTGVALEHDAAVGEDAADAPLWETYRDGTRRVAAVPGVPAFETALLLPLGEHGVVAVGSTDGTFTTEDEQYTEILARTTQVALEQVDQQRELRESRTSVQRRNEQVEFFNGVLRHSLRNAMLVIRGRAEYVRDNVPADQHRHLDSITEWCEELSEMSETIRAINETVTASERQRLATIDLSATLACAIEDIEAAHPSARIEANVGREYVRANGLAKAVLDRVLENAVEHNESGDPTVRISTQEAGDWLQLHIADDGPGVSDELKAAMFERSFKPNHSGDGFGLYFVSVMMELYGGKVWFEDNDPAGTVTVLEFQRATNPAPAEGPRDESVTTGEAQSKSADN
ncbi:sensor histidine kinase [Haloarcula marina]|uniref:sensor histidine kinase n=1 Tax=Haloarcula marina TaxID=2961574 RepID=UPI0020B7864B|nr:histidine kinase N-terminal 7TM domain-containing protein [Halomicroarcula marina]